MNEYISKVPHYAAFYLTSDLADYLPLLLDGTMLSWIKGTATNLHKKHSQVRSDIFFLARCKQINTIPKDLQVTSPLY